MQIYGINLGENITTVQNWVNSLGLTYPILLDPSLTVWNQYGMGYIPHNSLLDTNMVVLYTAIGYDPTAITALLNNFYSPVSATNTMVYPSFMRLNQDTLTINSQMINVDNHNALMKAIITSIDSSYIDSIPMFDDGNHDDGQAGDLLYGGYVLPLSAENEYSISIELTDLDFNATVVMNDAARFTTIGPVNFANYLQSFILANRVYFKLILKNDGLTKTAKNISASLSTTDLNVTSILNNPQYFGDIDPGQTSMSQQNYGVILSNLAPVTTINFAIDIYSNGTHFWSDTTDIVVNIDQFDNEIPSTLILRQNYPNPFNPSTTIEFEIPFAAYTSLKIFNILGEEVTTLVSGSLTPGKYKYSWNAENLPGGIYYSKLVSGSFVRTGKLILMK